MPRISMFFGIVIYMYYKDHNPPHFHARYGEHQAIYDITNMSMLEGWLPQKAHVRVRKWGNIHRGALMDDWMLTQSGQQPLDIPPLEK